MIISRIKKLKRFIIGNYRKVLLFYLSNSKNEVGKGFYCGKNCTVSRKNIVRIGNNFYMGRNCHLGANLEIEDNVMFASYVACVGGDHKVDNIETTINKSGRDVFKTIHIQDNVWIGHGSILLHGIKIHSGAVIAAGSVVTKDVPQNAIFGGNPAQLIRYRKI